MANYRPKSGFADVPAIAFECSVQSTNWGEMIQNDFPTKNWSTDDRRAWNCLEASWGRTGEFVITTPFIYWFQRRLLAFLGLLSQSTILPPLNAAPSAMKQSTANLSAFRLCPKLWNDKSVLIFINIGDVLEREGNIADLDEGRFWYL